MRKFIQNLFKSKTNQFVLGKPFPWKEYAVKNTESIRPVLKTEGFDIVICLSNISNIELEAFSRNKAILSVKNILGIPYMVLDFNGAFNIEFSLNILKLKEEYREPWIEMQEPACDIMVFLVEATNTCLAAIRTCPFNDMNYIREICADQLSANSKDIDNIFMMVQQMYGANDVILNADKQYSFDVLSL